MWRFFSDLILHRALTSSTWGGASWQGTSRWFSTKTLRTGSPKSISGSYKESFFIVIINTIIIHYSLSSFILRGIPNINIRSSKYMAWIAEQGMPVHMHVEKVGMMVMMDMMVDITRGCRTHMHVKKVGAWHNGLGGNDGGFLWTCASRDI